MKFSEQFNIKYLKKYRWYDPLLNLDTKLFIDPFLIYDNEFDEFVGSHESIIQMFQHQFELIASTGGVKTKSNWRKAENNLLFPEVEELCLGYTAFGTGGSGSGKDVARRVVNAIWSAIDTGVDELSHFEEIQLFEEGIARDRISDATANMLRSRFAKFTEKICKSHKIPTEEITYRRAAYDPDKKRWVAGTFTLPRNPYNNKPILLCPKVYLRPDPTINADAFWDYLKSEEEEILRNEFGDDIVSNLNKADIIQIALRNPDARERYIEYQEREGATPYDHVEDPKGLLAWYSETRNWIKNNPQSLMFSKEGEFRKFILELIEMFRNYVENQGGWKLLWNDNHTPRTEDSAQRLFQGIVMHACRANNVDISKEVNISRGPVDFKASQGAIYRALIELKLARNTKFWNGLERQLPKYLEAEEISIGHFVVIARTDKDLDKTIDIEKRTKKVSEKTSYKMNSTIVDAARDNPSASKL